MNAPSPPRARLPVRIRGSRVSDLSSLVRLYRDRSEASKQTYHPFPFGRFRLALIYLWIIALQRWMRWFMRYLPRRAATLLVVEREDQPGLIGYGTIRLMSGRGEEPIARFGYLVADAYQGKGVGGQLIEVMIAKAKELGIRKGGGTVLQRNIASAHLIEKWGWKLRPAAADRGAPDESNLMTVGDLDEILAKSRRPGKSS